VEPHLPPRGVPANISVVEESLEAAGDLLAGAADEGADVPGFEVAVAVDDIKDLDVAGRQGEVPVSVPVAFGLWVELAEARRAPSFVEHRSTFRKVSWWAQPRPRPFRANLW